MLFRSETLKMVLHSCQYLESVMIWCCDDYLSEKDIFRVFVTYSPKNFHELKLHYYPDVESELLPEELESFLASWADRVPLKSLSLITIRNDSDTLDKIDENMKIIEKYIRLGIIKGFKTIAHYLYDFSFDE